MIKTQQQKAAALRRKAESIVASRSAVTDMTDLETKRLLHELQVHQIELEMQNEELHRMIAEKNEHETHLHNIVKITPAGYFRIDPEGYFLDVNDAWLRMHGYDSKDEVVGKHFSMVQVDSSSCSGLVHLAELKRGIAIPFGEFESRRKDGSVGHHIFSAHPVVHSDAIVGFEWFIIDITRRILAENALKESEWKFQALFDNGHIGVGYHRMIYDDSGKAVDYYFIDTNEKYLELTGVDPRGKTVLQAFPGIENDPFDWIGTFGKVAKTGEAVRFEQYLQTNDRWYDIVSYQYKPDHFVAVFLDITDRKQAEENLRKSEERYRLLFNSGTDAVFVHEGQKSELPSKFIEVNDMACQRLGYTRDELLQMSPLDIDTPETITNIPAIMKALLADKTVRWEGVHISKDGRRIPVEMNTHLFEFEDKPVFLSVARDISERKRTERELRASENRMSSLYNISQHPFTSEQEFLDYALHEVINLTQSKIGYIYLYNEQNRQFTLNTWSHDVMRECSVQEQKTIYDLDSTGVWGEAVRQRKPILLNDFQAQHLLKKGYPEGHVDLTRFLTVPVICDEAVVAVVGVANKANDFTESDVMQLKLIMDSVWKIASSKRAEEALRQSEEHYRQLFDQMIGGIMVVDVIFDDAGDPCDHQFVQGNAAFEKLTGLRLEDEIGKTSKDMAISWPPDVLQKLYQVAINGGTIQYERYNESLDRYYDTKVYSPRRGQFAHIFTDITERKRAEEEKAHLEGQLQQAQKMESVGRLAGGVAHDFNNNLTVILGHTHLALMGLEPTQPLFANLEEISKAAERSADLTRQLLAFARKQTISTKVLNLNETIAGMLKMLQRLIGEDIGLTWIPGAELWQVKADPSQIDQIMANLCVNARDAIADVGNISIETVNCIIDEHYCPARDGVGPGQFVQLAVHDNGCGMDKETQSKIFEPFFTTKGVGVGTGLGLATVYGAVKQNNGFVTVGSESGAGTTFNIYLPRYLGNAQTVEKFREVEPALRGNGTILLVDDDMSILNITTKMLSSLGYDVIQADSPDAAIRLAKEHFGEINLLVTDVIMPEMNGHDLSVMLRQIKPQLKCLFMSGYTADVVANRGIVDEGLEFIQKPFILEGLAAKVRQILDSPSK